MFSYHSCLCVSHADSATASSGARAYVRAYVCCSFCFKPRDGGLKPNRTKLEPTDLCVWHPCAASRARVREVCVCPVTQRER